MSDAAPDFSSPPVATELVGNGLMIDGRWDWLEHIYDYEPGGHHPVHLGDLLYERYKVIHKLGHGGFANIWLCRDSKSDTFKYYAVKIMMSKDSERDSSEAVRVRKMMDLGFGKQFPAEYLALPLDHFEIKGPNGTHSVFVYPVLGPRVSGLSSLEVPKTDSELRKVCFQVTQAMATLHAHGVCHGDFRPANILACILNLDGLPEEDLFELVGAPQTANVVLPSGGQHLVTTAPQYLVYPIKWEHVADDHPELILPKACVIDFGQSFDVGAPREDLGIPQPYRAPECSLERQVGPGCDLWALGCTLYEIRTGKRLFQPFGDELDELLYQAALIFGKLPEPWWSDTWESRREVFQDEVDEDGMVVEVDDDIEGIDEPRSLQERLRKEFFIEPQSGTSGVKRYFPEDEIELFADLLQGLLRWDPKDRRTASEALEHAYFKQFAS
ncbi:kinase-like protein [Poronia punctata]|nr:kinase-like protein [Poronia punctata]